MKRRSTKGRDYRTKEYRNSRFAPKNGGGSPLGTASVIPGLIFLGLLAAGNLPKTMAGYIPLGGVLFVVWIVCLILVVRWDNRHIEAAENKASITSTRSPLTSEDDFVFNDPPSQAIAAPLSMPKAFEHEIAQLIQASTGKRTRVCGGAGDGGVDIEVLDAAGRVVGIVQCKAYLKGKALPPAPVRELYAVKIQRGMGSAYLVTTSHFSDGTRQEAEKLGIRIIDSAALARLREKQRVQNKVFAQPVPVANERVVTIQTGVRDLWQDN